MTTLKEQFLWAIPKTEDEINEIWKDAILTVDTNVLLDLYRVHKETRDSIIHNLSKFKGRLWLSHQVAKEFFNNRNEVITQAHVELDKSKSIVMNDIPREINNLINDKTKDYRGISKKFINSLKEELDKCYKSISEPYSNDMKVEFFIENDEILNSILDLFNDCVGNPFDEAELVELRKEGERRLENHIPPGFKDDKKTGDDRFGDFFVWEQILRYSKIQNKPIIFITGDKKEDWWEKHSGKTCGLHPLLKQEATKRLTKSILVYQTDSFLYHMQKRENINAIEQESLQNAIQDIKELNLFKEWDLLVREGTKLVKHNFQIVRNVFQQISFSSEYTNYGQISCTVTKKTHHFTVSGQLKPKLQGYPDIAVKLISAPKNIISEPYANTGTNYDFNIHLKGGRNELLPEGEYIFEYVAYVNYNEDTFDELEIACPDCGGLYLIELNKCFECGYSAPTECLRCHNSIMPTELGNELCGYCSHLADKI